VKVFPVQGFDNSKFQQEFQNLRRLKHQNVVKLIGFCNETENENTVFEGKQVSTNRIHLALCLEYVHNGSLRQHIHDANTGYNWATRYRIIRGACEGLKYLHEGLEFPLLHLDLKPDNILLDNNMTPKIADFGVSRFFDEKNTTEWSSRGTRGYCPPEYITGKKVTQASDIFSLGVIIVEIMTGHKGYELIEDMANEEFVDRVHDNWRKRLGESEILSPRLLEAYCKQVKRCIEIALQCITLKRRDRPTIQEIVTALIETETVIGIPVLQIEQFREKEPVLPKRVTPEWSSHG
jgi:serine/threonine protein kinase